MSTELELYDNPFSVEKDKPIPLVSGSILVYECAKMLKEKGHHQSILLRSDIRINGVSVPQREWETYVIKVDDLVQVYAKTMGGGGGGGGGKGIMGAVLGVILMATGIGIGAGLALGVLSAGVWGSVAVGAVGLGLSMLGNSLAPTPKMPELSGGGVLNTETLYTTSGASNSIRPMQTLPIVIGMIRSVPDQCAKPYQYLSGNQQVIRQMFCVCAGDAEIWNVRAGTTPLEAMGIAYRVHRNWRGGGFSFFDRRIQTVSANANLKGWYVYQASSEPNCIGVSMILYFHGGLFEFNKKTGQTQTKCVPMRFFWVNTQTGQQGESYQTVCDNVQSVKRVQFSFNLPQGTYDFTVRAWDQANWIGNCQNYEDSQRKQIMEVCVVETQFVINEPVLIPTKYGKTLIEIQAVASDKLSGAIGNLNCMARRMGKYWNGTNVIDVQTSNLSAQALSVLIDNNLVQGLEETPIDYKSFQDFYHHCDKFGWAANSIEMNAKQLGVMIQDILTVGDGFINFNSGKVSVYYDNPSRDYVDVVTPRNSWDLKITMEKPIHRIDCIRFIFNNERMDYQQDEIMVYRDGYNAGNARNIFTVETSKLTNPDLCWKRGRLLMADIDLRSAKFQFYTDWRSIDYDLGHKIRFMNNLVFIGVGTGKIIDFEYNENGYITVFVIDQYLSLEMSKTYTARVGIKKRTDSYELKQTSNDSTNRLFLEVPLAPDKRPELFIPLSIGETTKDTIELLIKRIERQQDYVALVHAIPACPEYLQAITGAIPPHKSYLTDSNSFDVGKPSMPELLGYKSDETAASLAKDGSIILNANISLRCATKKGVTFKHYYVEYLEMLDGVETGDLKKFATPTDFEVVVPDLQQGKSYVVKINAVSTNNIFSDVLVVNVFIDGLISPPPAPSMVYLQGMSLMITLDPKPVDFLGFEVRMSYDEKDTFEVSKVISTPYNYDGIFDITEYYGTARKVFVRTFDKFGLSSEVVSLSIGLGDPKVENVIFEDSQAEREWSGIITNGELFNNMLESIDVCYTIANKEGTSFVVADKIDTKYLWSTTSPTSKVVYEYTIFPEEHYIGARLDVKPQLNSGIVERIEIAERNDSVFTIADRTKVEFPIADKEGKEYIIAEVRYTDFFVLPVNYKIKDTLSIKIRVTFSQTVFLQAADIITIYDVEDKKPIVHEDTVIPATGLFIQVPEKYFRRITNVNISMRAKKGYETAFTAKTIYKGEIQEGYVVDGVIINCYDILGEKTEGVADITIQGF